MNESTNRITLVEEGTEINGTIVSDCAVLVKGNVQGQIEAPSLTVAEQGAVRGQVHVKDLVSDGEIEGDLQAESVQLSGRVKDKTVIRAKKLDVKLNADAAEMQVVFGSVNLEIGDEPQEKQEQDSTPPKSEANEE